jgi:hypothetical protein
MQPGVVDQYVDSSVDLGDFGHDRVHPRFVGNIAGNGNGPRADLPSRQLYGVFVAINQRNEHSLPGERGAECLAKAATAAGYDSDSLIRL